MYDIDFIHYPTIVYDFVLGCGVPVFKWRVDDGFQKRLTVFFRKEHVKTPDIETQEITILPDHRLEAREKWVNDASVLLDKAIKGITVNLVSDEQIQNEAEGGLKALWFSAALRAQVPAVLE